VDRRTGYLRVVDDGSEVDHRSVAQRSDVEEPAERGGVASRALSYDLLLKVGPGIRPEVEGLEQVLDAGSWERLTYQVGLPRLTRAEQEMALAGDQPGQIEGARNLQICGNSRHLP
jgi:hypothetical protein